MTVRNLAGAGLVLVAFAGPLLAVGLAGTDLPMAALTGIGVLWLGVVLVFAALLQLGRVEHRMLRTQGRSLAGITAAVDDLRAAADTDELDERFATLSAELQAALDTQRSDLLGVVDARVLGIHETVRDLARGERA